MFQALQTDIGTGDVTSLATVPKSLEVRAAFVARERCTTAGLDVVTRVFFLLDPDAQVLWSRKDGEEIAPGTTLGMISGRAHTVLKGERIALNLMQRMSGIATATHQLAQAVHPVRVRDTRKTAPCLTLLDKWAVNLGGGENHRLGLYDRILIKDNHVATAGNVSAAIKKACQYRDRHASDMRIEVEVRTMDEVSEALATGGFDELLLDNMIQVNLDGHVDVTRLNQALTLIDGQYTTEASGNITLHTAQAIANTKVDYVSCGALTHSTRAIDLALKVLEISHGNQ